MIIGVTHEESGEPRISRTVTIKVATGEAPKGEKGHPKALDHFIFLRKVQQGKDIVWTPDQKITDHYGQNPREIWVTFMHDDPETVFRTEYAAYVKRGRWCHGDGKSAKRRDPFPTKKDPAAWGDFKIFNGPCAEDGCTYIDDGFCGPSGDFYFMLSEFPTLGSICRLHTGSWQSIRQISSAIHDIRRITGGRLTGVQAKLFMHPDRSAYEDATGAQRTGTKWVLGLELAATDLAALKGKMLEAAETFQKIQLQLGPGRLVVEEDDGERGRELTPEFYPKVDADPEPTKTVTGEEQMKQELRTLMKKHAPKITEAQIEQKFEMYRGRIAELLEKAREYDAPAPKTVVADPPAASKEEPKQEAPKQEAKVENIHGVDDITDDDLPDNMRAEEKPEEKKEKSAPAPKTQQKGFPF
jgi:hypothetical protein